MKRLALLALVVAVVALAASPFGVGGSAAAQEPEVSLSQASAAIGEQVVLTFTLEAPGDAVVELDPAAEAWGEVRVIRILSQGAVAVDGGLVHRFEVLIAPFAPGPHAFRPALLVTDDSGVTPLALPALTIEVPSVLAPGEPLILSLLPPPVSIAGAQSPLFWPAVVIVAVVLAALVVGVVVVAVRWWRSRPRTRDAPALPPEPDDVLASAARLLETDAVEAYRAISSAVRNVLGERYAFPARSLTTAELESRMEGVGVDGWDSRMARELLRECDAVVYAGYRPALERRQADLTVAREIVATGEAG